jgi:hypothetical protein
MVRAAVVDDNHAIFGSAYAALDGKRLDVRSD